MSRYYVQVYSRKLKLRNVNETEIYIRAGASRCMSTFKDGEGVGQKRFECDANAMR